jgi:hypothetical protein
MRTTTGITNYGMTLDEAKLYLRIDTTDEDDLLSALITASYDQVIAECNRDFSPCTHSFNVASSSGDIFLTTQDVDTVSQGELKEVAGSWYTYIPSTYSGAIEYTVCDGSAYPNNVRIAQMILVSNWFENRLPQAIGVSTSPLDFSVNAMLSPYKLIKPV